MGDRDGRSEDTAEEHRRAPHYDESQAEQVAHLVPSEDIRAVSGRLVRLTRVMSSGDRAATVALKSQ